MSTTTFFQGCWFTLMLVLFLGCASLSAEFPVGACESVVYLNFDELLSDRSSYSKLILVDQFPGLTPHRQLVIREDRAGVSVEVRTAVDQAIDLQLDSLRKRFPEASLETLCSKLKVVRRVYRLEHPQQAGIKGLLSALENLQVPALLTSEIVLDGPILDIWIAQGPNFSHFSMMGNDLHPLHLWTNRLWKEIDSALLQASPP